MLSSEKWTDLPSAPEHAKNMGPVTSTLLLGGFLIQDTPSVTVIQPLVDAPRDPGDPAVQSARAIEAAPRDPGDPAVQASIWVLGAAPWDPGDPAVQALNSSTAARLGICQP